MTLKPKKSVSTFVSRYIIKIICIFRAIVISIVIVIVDWIWMNGNRLIGLWCMWIRVFSWDSSALISSNISLIIIGPVFVYIIYCIWCICIEFYIFIWIYWGIYYVISICFWLCVILMDCSVLRWCVCWVSDISGYGCIIDLIIDIFIWWWFNTKTLCYSHCWRYYWIWVSSINLFCWLNCLWRLYIIGLWCLRW